MNDVFGQCFAGLASGSVVKLMGARYGIMLSGLLSGVGLISLIICACATDVYVLFAGQILTG